MKRLVSLCCLVGFLAGCRKQPAGIPTAGDIQIRERAGAFLRETLSKLPPGAKIEKLEKSVQYRLGDLFKVGHDVCVAAFIEEEKSGEYTFKHSTGPVLFSRRSGEWKLRSSFSGRGSPFKHAFGLKDMSGDDVPEAVFYEGFGATGNTSEHIFKYDRRADSLVCSAEGLSRPRLYDGKVSCYSKCGGLCVGWETYAWSGNLLLRQESGSRHISVVTYLVGPGTSVATIDYAKYGPTGRTIYSWKISGNLPDYNRLEDLPDDMRESLDDIVLHLRIGRRRRRVRIRVDAEKARALGFEPEYREWAWPILKTVTSGPEKFSVDAKCGDGDARISDFASVEIEEDFRGIAHYEGRHLFGNNIEKLPELSAPYSVTVSTRAPGREDKPRPLTSKNEARLSIRGPDMKVRAGCRTPPLGKLFLVRSVRIERRTIHIGCEVRPSRVNVPHWPEKTFRPAAVLNLGKLRPGSYKAIVTIEDARGGERPPRHIEHSFRVARRAR